MKAILFGAESQKLEPEVRKHSGITLVEEEPDVVLSYGGDGTLLAAERRWPGIPKVPIKNSRRGIRCLAHPPAEVIQRLAEGRLVRTEYLKLACEVQRADAAACVTAMNEINVHMGRINSAVRFKLWVDDEPYGEGREIIGDGFVISTPFGSTAYFNHITRGVFYAGMGVAFKAPTEQTDHIVVPEESAINMLISRGPAVLACDNSTEYHKLGEGDSLVVRKHAEPAVLLTWQRMSHPSDEF
jgi:NAD+ kinase